MMPDETLVEKRVEELVDAGFATVSRNPSDWEATRAWRYAIRTAVEQAVSLEERERVYREALEHVRRIAEPLIQLDDVWEDATHIVTRIDTALSAGVRQND